MTSKTVNILVAGVTGVGKTSYINQVTTGRFTNEPSDDNKEVTFSFKRGRKSTFKFTTDFRKETVFDGAIIMFDLTNETTFGFVKDFLQIVRIKTTGLVIICGNKADDEKKEVDISDCLSLIDKKCQYIDLSVKNMYNIEKPVLYLAKYIYNDEDLRFEETNPLGNLMDTFTDPPTEEWVSASFKLTPAQSDFLYNSLEPTQIIALAKYHTKKVARIVKELSTLLKTEE